MRMPRLELIRRMPNYPLELPVAIDRPWYLLDYPSSRFNLLPITYGVPQFFACLIRKYDAALGAPLPPYPA